MDIPTDTRQPAYGVSFMLMSVMVFAVMDALVKWLSSDYPVYQIMFFRSAVALIPVAIFIAHAGGLGILKTDRMGLHVFRSGIGVCAMACAFYGIANTPLAEAMAIFHSAPILMTALSVPLLKEKVGIRRWTAVVVGFLGMLLVVKPGPDIFSGGAIFMVLAAFFVALTSNIIRALSKTDDPACITFYFTLTATVVSGLVSLFLGWQPPSRGDVLLLMSVGVLGGCGQYLMTLSFKHAEVGLVSPLKYLMIVIGGIFGYLFWSEVPDVISVSGILIIITSGVYTMHRETRHRRQSALDPGKNS